MIVFDPIQMTAPLARTADALREQGAFATLVQVERDGRAATLAAGVSDLGTGAEAGPARPSTRDRRRR